MKNFNERSETTETVDRREFMKASGILAAGLIMAPHLFAKNFNNNPSGISFSKAPIVPLFVLSICERLGTGSEFIGADLKHCLTSDSNHITAGNAFYMGPTVPFGTTELIQALENIKTKMDVNPLDFGLSQRLAVISGALIFQSTKNLLDVDSAVKPGANLPFSEEQIYRDATVLRTFFNKGNPFSSEDAEKIESLFHEIVPRIFIRFHTLMPDDYGWPDDIDFMLQNGAEWIVNMQKWREQTGNYFSSLANAIANPDKVKVQEYIRHTNFFDKRDSMLVRISPRNRIANTNREGALNLIDQAHSESKCSQAIASGYQTLISINDYITGQINIEEIAENLTGS